MTRDEVIKALECCIVSEIEWECPKECPRFSKSSGKPCEAALMCDALAMLKAEPKRGQPNPYDSDWRVCSVCGTGTEIVRHEDGGTTEYGYRYCPWCGARMEEERL